MTLLATATSYPDSPHVPEVLYLLGWSELATGQPRAAARSFQRALALAHELVPQAQLQLAEALQRVQAEERKSEIALYQRAYTDFSTGKYMAAIGSFQEFLAQFPNSELADNARYWIGESYFSLARTYSTRGQPDKARAGLERAVQEFGKVLDNYPRGDKVPTAVFRKALAYLDLGKASLARLWLQYVVKGFPESVEAPLAREQLAALKKGQKG